MSKYATICPVGFVKQDILLHVAECVKACCGLTCRISSPIGNPEYAYDEARQQYNSKAIIKRLLKVCSPDSFKIIGITRVDLYVPVLKYVFGLAQMEGRCSVVSLHRLRPRFYEEPQDQALLMARVEKTALHELGHSLGLTHCRDRFCVMHSSVRIEDTDTKQPRFCPTCFELFKWFLNQPPRRTH